jgi:hypothetical protein
MICRSGAASACLSVRPATACAATGDAALAQEHRPLNHVLQLANVARPVISLQCCASFVGKAANCLPRVLANAGEEVLGQ